MAFSFHFVLGLYDHVCVKSCKEPGSLQNEGVEHVILTSFTGIHVDVIGDVGLHLKGLQFLNGKSRLQTSLAKVTRAFFILSTEGIRHTKAGNHDQ